MKNMIQNFIDAKVSPLVVGAAGAVGVEAAELIHSAAEAPTSEIVHVVIQIVIGIATLFKLLRKNKKEA